MRELPQSGPRFALAGLLPSSMAIALNAFGQILHGDDSTPGTILGSDAPVLIDVSPESDLEISNVKVPVGNSTVKGVTFTLRNLSDKNLVAYSVDVKLYWDIDPNPFHLRLTEDAWFLYRSLLPPGASKDGIIRSTVSPAKPMKLLRIVVTPDYAEFADGSVYGSNNDVAAKLAASRKTESDVQQAYAAKLRSGATADALMKSIQADMESLHPGADTNRRLALTRIQDAIKSLDFKEASGRILKPISSVQ